MKQYIFGAKAIAISVCKAWKAIYPEEGIQGFVVSDMAGNPKELLGLPVLQIDELAECQSQEEKVNTQMIIATPEDVHEAIVKTLQRYGYRSYKRMDSVEESELMEKYFRQQGRFRVLHDLPCGEEKAKISVYAAKFFKDKILSNPPVFPEYVHSILLGNAYNTDAVMKAQAEFVDDTGDHISEKNPNFCETTAFYWMWKNRLMPEDEYVGLYHYRRALDITDEDLYRLKAGDVDAVLQYPLLHLPDIREHHTRYVREEDWEAMLEAMRRLYPEYAARYEEIFSLPYFYNYNLIIAKKEVFAQYCEWLFSILFLTEQLSTPKGWERADRYTAYMSESLMTFYFLYHEKDLKIYHTGRRLYT